jgi:hypothetical protein
MSGFVTEKVLPGIDKGAEDNVIYRIFYINQEMNDE